MSNNALSYTQVFAWGSDTSGQMGLASKSTGKNYAKPRFCSFNIVIHSISCGDEHSAFIASNGYIYTMGSNVDGRLGISSRNLKYSASPCLIESLSRNQAVKVACGGAHTAALMETGQVYTWGNGVEGQLGIGTLSNHHSPQLVNFIHPQTNSPLETFCVDLDCGSYHTGAITDRGELYMFGSGAYGQLGTGRLEKEILPCKIELYSHVASVSCGFQHTLLLTEHSKVYSCGNNSLGQLGTGGHKNSWIFQKVSFSNGDVAIKKISANRHSAAISETGDLYLWGPLPFGEVTHPQRVALEKNNPLMDVALGDDFGCAVDIAGTVYSWGHNQQGELGLGDYEARKKPTVVASLEDKKVLTVACGGKFCIALGMTVVAKDKDRDDDGVKNVRAVEQSRIENQKRKSVPTRERSSKVMYQSDSRFLKQREDRSQDAGPKYRGSFYIERPKEFEDERNKSMMYDEPQQREMMGRTKDSNPYYKLMIDMWREGRIPGKQQGKEGVDKSHDKSHNKSTGEVQERPSKGYKKHSMNISVEGGEQEQRGGKEGKSGGREGKEGKTKDVRNTTMQSEGKSFEREQRNKKETLSKRREGEDSAFGGTRGTVNESEGFNNTAEKRTSTRTGERGLNDTRELNERESYKNKGRSAEGIELLKRENAMLRENLEDLKRQLRENERNSLAEEGAKHEKVLQRRFEKLERDYNVMEKELQMEKETVLELKVSLEEERRNNQRFLKDIEEQRAVSLMLEGELRNLKDNKNAKNSSIVGEAEKERDFLRRKTEELQRIMSHNAAEFEEILKQKEEEAQALEDKNIAMQQAIERMSEALKKNSKEERAQKEFIERLENENEERKKVIKGLEMRLSEAQTKLQVSETAKQTMREQHEEMLDAYDRKFAVKNEEVMELKTPVEGYVQKIEDLSKENRDMRELVEALDKALQAKAEEVQDLKNMLSQKQSSEEPQNAHSPPKRLTREPPHDKSRSHDRLSSHKKHRFENSRDLEDDNREAALNEVLFGANNQEDNRRSFQARDRSINYGEESQEYNDVRRSRDDFNNRRRDPSPLLRNGSNASSPGKGLNRSLKHNTSSFFRERREEEYDEQEDNERVEEVNESMLRQERDDFQSQSKLQEQINKSAAKIIQLLGIKASEGFGNESYEHEHQHPSEGGFLGKDLQKTANFLGTGSFKAAQSRDEYQGTDTFGAESSFKEQLSQEESLSSIANKKAAGFMNLSLSEKMRFFSQGEKENIQTEGKSGSASSNNLNELKTKLQDLQKNKIALEQRMQDFEKKLKESKNK